jgi:septum formation protein
MTTDPHLILASTSAYRRELLARLGLPFEVAAPDVDESALPGEHPRDLALRLALAKARAVGAGRPDALVIGSDQVAAHERQTWGKPLERARALAQLREMSGRTIIFHTALCLLDTRSGAHALDCVPTEVGFRDLSAAEIERYVDREQPFHCAGSAKVESLGISLLRHVRGDDPTALIGLPLIALCGMLRAAGVAVP